MFCWLNSKGYSVNDSTNKRSRPTTNSSIVGTLSSMGEIAEYITSSKQSDGIWYNFASDTMNYWVRNDVCDFVSFADQPAVKLNIKFHSQNDTDSNMSYNDCGPASSCIMLERGNVSVTVNEFMQSSGITHGGFTDFNDNIRGIAIYGYTGVYVRPMHLSDIIKELQKGNPVFSLVRYTHLNPGKNYGHFLVPVGYRLEGKKLIIIAHDPNRQPYMEFTADQFALAIAYQGSNENLPYQSMVIVDYPEIEKPVEPPVIDFQSAVLNKLDRIIELLEENS